MFAVREFSPAALALEPDSVVHLALEPHNTYDPNAILVNSPDGEKIGYIPRDKTTIIHEALRDFPSSPVIAHVATISFKKNRITSLLIIVTNEPTL